MTVYVICPQAEKPVGGVQKLYRHVDILNKHGIAAYIVQKDETSRYAWTDNNTPIVKLSGLQISATEDYLVIPEIYGPTFYRSIRKAVEGVRKVIFNQNCYYTFSSYPLLPEVGDPHYVDPADNVIASLVVSDDSERYLNYLFPNHPVKRIVNSVDPTLFEFQSRKKNKIAFMPRKRQPDLKQVLHILSIRGVLDQFELVPLDDMKQAQVADTLREASLFLSFSSMEGFGLPPVEAMACGALVIGYTGQGGEEYFDPSFSYPILEGNIQLFARTVEEVVQQLISAPDKVNQQRRLAAAYVREHYSPQKEEESIIRSWHSIFELSASSNAST